MPMSGSMVALMRPTWFPRHAALTVVMCFLLGSTIGFLLVISLRSEEGLMREMLLKPLSFLAATGAGAMVGGLIGVVLVRIGQTGLECPRCGTLNQVNAPACSACGFTF